MKADRIVRWALNWICPWYVLLKSGSFLGFLLALAFDLAALGVVVYGLCTLELFPPTAIFLGFVVHVSLVTVSKGREAKFKLGRSVVVLGATTVVAVVALALAFGRTTVASIATDALEPTLFRGEVVLFDKKGDEAQRGDLILIRCSGGKLDSARLIAQSGQEVSVKGWKVYAGEGDLYSHVGILKTDENSKQAYVAKVGDRLVLIYPPAELGDENSGKIRVPDGDVLVLKDNRSKPRVCGGKVLIPQESIVGRARYILWSRHWERIGLSL